MYSVMPVLVEQPGPTAQALPTLIVAATDGRPHSDTVLSFARQLLTPGDTLRLASVVTPINLVPESVLIFSAELEAERRAELQSDVAAQTERVWGARAPAEMLDGDPARALARLARETDASLIVTPLGKGAGDDRHAANETVLKLMRLADTPIVAVSDSLRHVPRRVVVAVDFSETSVQAARLAIHLAAPGATITIVHVAPHSHLLRKWPEIHRQNASRALEQMLAHLESVDGKQLHILLLNGDPATEILAVAAKLGADLIATGTHGHRLLPQFLIGSLASKMIRSAECSVLVFPQSAVFSLNRDRQSTRVPRSVDIQKWIALFNDISWQNAGRVVTLEIDDPDIGSQVQIHDRAFDGAAYDPHDQSVLILFATGGPSGDHFTHSIIGVTGVDVLQDTDGADVAVRIAHGKGQTILSFGERTS